MTGWLRQEPRFACGMSGPAGGKRWPFSFRLEVTDYSDTASGDRVAATHGIAATVVTNGRPSEHVSLVELRRGFRDEYQLQSAQAVVLQRLADDREQEECRVPMRFWWQLAMTYQEVTEADLDRHVAPAKREAVHGLINAISHSPDAIDTWIADVPKRFPHIRDRGYEAWRTTHNSC